MVSGSNYCLYYLIHAIVSIKCDVIMHFHSAVMHTSIALIKYIIPLCYVRILLHKDHYGSTQLFFYFAKDATLRFTISKRKQKLPTVVRMGINCDFPPPSPPRLGLRFARPRPAVPWRKITPRKGTITMH